MTFMKEKIETFVNNAANRKPVRKYRYIKPFALLLAAVLLCGMSGCSKNEGEVSKQESSLGDSQNISSDNSIEDFEPVPVPEGGWTIETAAETFFINNKPISYPFAIDSLGKEFVINDKDTIIDDSGHCSTFVYCNDEIVFGATYERINNTEDILSANPKGISISTDENTNPNVSLNGVTLGASRDEVEAALGKPQNDQNDPLWAYVDSKTGKSCIGMRFDENKLCTITLLFY